MRGESTPERAGGGQSRSHTVRTKDGGTKALKYGRKSAIAIHCTECMGFEEHPSECTARLCALYPFRAKTLQTQRGDGVSK